ncbi:MAG TPA: dihydrodipicolinate synthase family protein [Candidatus Eremiobacteraceae bacterium]|nr:dihydrodipicolinate synthase family protein [Candidatus Eremiobacteraceae bacterium]
MISHLMAGVICATLTPLDDNGEPCIELLVDHCKRLLHAGCSGIVLLGTTGEANSFTVEERKVILEAVISGGVAAERLIVGTGCCAVGDCVSLTRHALSHGSSRVLVLPPFYYKSVSDAGVVESYARTIEAIDDDRLRLYFYNIPQMSGVEIRAAAIELLVARYPGIIAGIKDSAGKWPSTEELCSRFGGVLDVLVGSETFLSSGIAAGASGCVSATANAFAASISELYAKAGEPGAAAIQHRVSAARAIFEQYPVIAALKEFEARRSGDGRWRNLRPPLTTLTDSDADALWSKARIL